MTQRKHASGNMRRVRVFIRTKMEGLQSISGMTVENQRLLSVATLSGGAKEDT